MALQGGKRERQKSRWYSIRTHVPECTLSCNILTTALPHNFLWKYKQQTQKRVRLHSLFAKALQMENCFKKDDFYRSNIVFVALPNAWTTRNLVLYKSSGTFRPTELSIFGNGHLAERSWRVSETPCCGGPSRWEENGGLASCLRAAEVNQPFWKNLNVPHNPKPQTRGAKTQENLHPRTTQRERESQARTHGWIKRARSLGRRQMEVMDQVILTSSILQLFFLQGCIPE